MEMEVRRELQRSILTAELDMPDNTEQYQFRMIKNNQIPGLLKCDYQHVDGKLRLVFDITGMQRLGDYWEGRDIPGEDIRWIFQSVLDTFEQTGKYLLSGEGILLCPDYIYINARKKSVELCFIPGRNVNIFRELHALTEYFLKKAGHDDREGVMLIYELYRLTSQDQYDLKEFKEALEPALASSSNAASAIKEEPREQKSFDSDTELCGEDQWEDEVLYFDLSEEEDQTEPPQKSCRHTGVINTGREKLIAEGRKYKKGAAAVTAILTAAAIIWLIKAGAFYGENGLKLGAGFLMASAVTAYIVVKGKDRSDEEEAEDCPEYLTENATETVVLRSGKMKDKGTTTCGWLKSCEQKDICISHTPFLLGKQSGEADGYIHGDTVSRKHAKIERKKQSFYLTDMHSTNGTRLNGRKLKPGERVQINEYDKIIFADKEFEFYVQ